MAPNWAPGIDAVGLGFADAAGAYAEDNLTWLYTKEDHDWDLGLSTEERNWERMNQAEVQQLVNTTLLPTFSVDGDANAMEIGIPLRGVMGAPTGPTSSKHTFKLGGVFNTAAPFLCAALVQGKVDGTTSPTIHARKLSKVRIPRLHFFLNSPGGQLKYEHDITGVYGGHSALTAPPDFDGTGKDLFNQGGFISLRNAGSLPLISFDMTIMWAADPRWTSVAATQANYEDYTLPTGFQKGGTRVDIDFTWYADEEAAPDTVEGVWAANNSDAWDLRFSGSSSSLLRFIIPRVMYSNVKTTKQGNGHQQVNVQGTGTYSAADTTQLIVELTNTFASSYNSAAVP